MRSWQCTIKCQISHVLAWANCQASGGQNNMKASAARLPVNMTDVTGSTKQYNPQTLKHVVLK